jgi:hypothetical protein
MSEPDKFDPKDTPLPVAYLHKKYSVSRTTWWRYEKAGLNVIRVGSKAFCRESEFVAFLQRMNGQTIPATRAENTASKGDNE